MNIIKAHSIAKETGAFSTCKVLEALYPDVDFNETDNRPVTERIKTFEEACASLGEDHHFVEAYRAVEGMTGFGADFYAFLKLRIITAALNEGWEPQFTQEEDRWYPWFFLWTADELAERDAKWKRNNCLISMQDYRGEWAGLASAYSYYAPSHTSAVVGSRLCFKSNTLAEYAGKQFIDLWMDFYLIRK